MVRPLADWAGNVVLFAVVIAVNVLSNVLPINGQTLAEISARYPTLFTPAGYTFAIWSLIYLGLALFVTFQALPAQRDSTVLAAIRWPFQLSCAANVAWILAWHYDLLWLALLVMLLLLASLARVYAVLHGSRDRLTVAGRWCVAVPFSVYTAWILVATLANLSIVQYAAGWSSAGLEAVDWTLLKLALAGSVAAIMTLRLGDVAFGIVLAWAAFGIADKQSATPAVAGAADLLVVLSLVLAGATLLGRWKRRRRD